MKQIFRAFFPAELSSRPLWQAIIFAATMAPLTPLLANDFAAVTGTVTDDILQQPIAGVTVTALPDGLSASTNQDGRYTIARILPGTISLHFESAFHSSKQLGPFLVRQGEVRTVDCSLHPITIQTPSQTVLAQPEHSPGLMQFHLQEIRQSTSADVGAFLDQKGFHIQSDGRSRYLSLGGLSPQRVLVLVDGVRLNPDGGAVDLSLIPLSTVERIEVHTSGGAARFGADALGGAVNIISRKATDIRQAPIELSTALGSYAYSRQAVHASPGRVGGLRLLGDYEYSQSSNDYNYTHPYLGEQKRTNNFSRHYSTYLAASYSKFKPLTFSLRLFNRHSGIPGAVLQETPGATAKHRSGTTSIAYRDSSFEASGSYKELTDDFRDQLTSVRYDQHYLQIGRQFEITKHLTYQDKHSASLGGQYLSESFFNDDRLKPSTSLPYVSRKTAALYASVKGRLDWSTLTQTAGISYRIDRIENETHTSPHFSLSLTERGFVACSVDANYSESFRLPPIDALFWSSDVFAVGNPDLHPERAKARNLKVGLSSQRLFKIDASVAWFGNDVDGMIYWRRRFDGKYTPVNLERARITGTESSIALATHDDRFSVQYHRTAQSPLNKSVSENYYDLTIPFQPDRIERLTIVLRLWRAKIEYRYSLTGRRFIREANTKSLPVYHLHDLSLELTAPLLHTEQTFAVSAYNIANEDYEILERVPMPGRSITVTFSVKL